MHYKKYGYVFTLTNDNTFLGKTDPHGFLPDREMMEKKGPEDNIFLFSHKGMNSSMSLQLKKRKKDSKKASIIQWFPKKYQTLTSGSIFVEQAHYLFVPGTPGLGGSSSLPISLSSKATSGRKNRPVPALPVLPVPPTASAVGGTGRKGPAMPAAGFNSPLSTFLSSHNNDVVQKNQNNVLSSGVIPLPAWQAGFFKDFSLSLFNEQTSPRLQSGFPVHPPARRNRPVPVPFPYGKREGPVELGRGATPAAGSLTRWPSETGAVSHKSTECVTSTDFTSFFEILFTICFV